MIPTSLDDFVLEKFKDKVDKAGKPYIEHLRRVAYPYSISMNNTKYAIALLHDIFEDTDTTEDELLTYVTPFVIDVVKILTRKKDESYMDYIKRIAVDKTATEIKLYDLKDNMDITRLKKITDEDVNRLKKYHKAFKFLQEKFAF